MSHQEQEDILARLGLSGLNMTVSKGGPPGPGNPPIGGAAADPGKAPPATSGGAEGSEDGGAGEGGEKYKNPGSLTLLTTYVRTFLFIFQDLNSVIQGEYCIS